MDFSKFVSLDSADVADTDEKLGTYSNRFSFVSDVDRFKQKVETVVARMESLDRKDVDRILFLCDKTPKIKHLSAPLFVLGWCLARGDSVESVMAAAATLGEMLQSVLNEPSVVRYSRFVRKIQAGDAFNFSIFPNKIL
jgi:enolase